MMTSKAQTLAELFAKQVDLNARQVAIAQDLVLVNQQIVFLLAQGASAGRVAGNVPTIAPAANTSRRVLAGSRIRQSWFERGETLKLLRSAAKKPVRPSELVRAVLALKGYDQDPVVAKKAGGAIYQAIIVATKNGTLRRDRAGRVRT